MAARDEVLRRFSELRDNRPELEAVAKKLAGLPPLRGGLSWPSGTEPTDILVKKLNDRYEGYAESRDVISWALGVKTDEEAHVEAVVASAGAAERSAAAAEASAQLAKASAASARKLRWLTYFSAAVAFCSMLGTWYNGTHKAPSQMVVTSRPAP